MALPGPPDRAVSIGAERDEAGLKLSFSAQTARNPLVERAIVGSKSSGPKMKPGVAQVTGRRTARDE